MVLRSEIMLNWTFGIFSYFQINAKYNIELEQEAREWLEEVLGRPLVEVKHVLILSGFIHYHKHHLLYILMHLFILNQNMSCKFSKNFIQVLASVYIKFPLYM